MLSGNIRFQISVPAGMLDNRNALLLSNDKKYAS